MPDFQVFDKSLLPLRRQPTVTLQRRGTISMNRAAYTAIGSPDAVELLFDPHARVIGLRKTDTRADNAHFVRPSTSAPSGPFIVSAMAFFNVYDIAMAESRRWHAFVDENVLCVDLTARSEPARRGQPGRSATA